MRPGSVKIVGGERLLVVSEGRFSRRPYKKGDVHRAISLRGGYVVDNGGKAAHQWRRAKYLVGCFVNGQLPFGFSYNQWESHIADCLRWTYLTAERPHTR